MSPASQLNNQRYFWLVLFVAAAAVLCALCEGRPLARPIRILIDHNIRLVEAIDAQAGTFHLGMDLEMVWLDDSYSPQYHDSPLLGITGATPRALLDGDEAWYPKLVFVNRSDIEVSEPNSPDCNFITSFYPPTRYRTGISKFYTNLTETLLDLSEEDLEKHIVWVHKVEINGLIMHDFDIHLFPFDHHILNFGVRLTRHKHSRYFIKHDFFRAGIHGDLVFHPTDFELVSIADRVHDVQDGDGMRLGAKDHSEYIISIEVTRRSTYYLWKFYLTQVLLIIVSFIVYWINPDDIATRSTIGLTAFLTIIAFSFSISEELPIVPYLTRLDIFMVSGYLLVFVSIIESLLVFWLAQAKRKTKKRVGDGEADLHHQILTAKIVSPIPSGSARLSLSKVIDSITLWSSVVVLVLMLIYTTPMSQLAWWLPGYDEGRASHGHFD